MVSTLIKIIGALGGGAVVFYIMGFSVVQSYIYKIGLEGVFWFTNEFYGDAGAKFFLEMIRAPLLAPYLFLPYLILLLFLVPRKKNLSIPDEDHQVISEGHSTQGSSLEEAIFQNRQWIKLSFLLLVMIGTYFFALFYVDLLENKIIDIFINNIILDPTDEPSRQTKQSITFFCLVTPMVIAFGHFLYRFHGCLKEGSRSRVIYQLTSLFYLVFLTIIPISYGFHLYDWKIVLIKEPNIIKSPLSKEKGDLSSSRIWLLGRFGGKYLFLKKERSGAEGIIESFDDDQIKYLNFDIKKAYSLREEMEKNREDDYVLSQNDVEEVLNLIE